MQVPIENKQLASYSFSQLVWNSDGEEWVHNYFVVEYDSECEFKLDEQGQGAWVGGNEMEVGPWWELESVAPYGLETV